MLHEYFAHALALERHAAGEQLVEDRAQGVDVDLLAVAAVGHLGGHVVDGADALRVPAATAARDELREAVVAQLHHAFIAEDIARLQVAVNDAVVVQIGHAGGDALEPDQDLGQGQALGMIGQFRLQALARHVLHHHPGIAAIVLADVVEREQVGVFEVEALPHAAEFGIEIAADELQGHFLAGVAGGVVDFAEAAAAHAALDGIAAQRPGAAGIQERSASAAARVCRRAAWQDRLYRPIGLARQSPLRT